jgi:S1-C subfamily serine protease
MMTNPLKVMLKVVLVLGSISVLAQRVSAESVDTYWAREDQLNEWFVEGLSKSVVLLENKTAGVFGTGVLLSGVSGDNDVRVFVLANNHLIKSQGDELYVYISDQMKAPEPFHGTLLRSSTTLDLAIFALNVNNRKTEDLIAMGFAVNASSTAIVIPPTNVGLVSGNFADPKIINRGRTVLFLGFPLMAGTRSEQIIRQIKFQNAAYSSPPEIRLVEKEPIARFGHIASGSDGSIFLIDAMVNHGNSGSPVFLRSGEATASVVTSKYLFAGIIRRFKDDDIVYKSEDGQVISIPHNSGLAEVISVEAIRNFIRGL